MSTALTILLLAVLGIAVTTLVLYLTRTAPIERVRWLDGHEGALEVGTAHFRETFSLLDDTPIVRGNHVELLVNGDETFPPLWDTLAAAHSSITWQVFWVKPGTLADRALDVLAQRARAGVRVLCLLDAFGSHGLGDAFASRLRAAGGEVEIFRPFSWQDLYKVQQRMHVRSVIVDGRVAFTGGFGIDDRWLGDGRTAGSWRDTNLRIEGPIVDRFQVTFALNWAETTGELILGHDAFAVHDGSRRHDGQFAGVMLGSPSLGSTTAERMFVLSILGARERLFLTNAYFVPGASLRTLLCRTAARGVDVRVLTPGGNTDRKSSWLAARSHYEELLEGGVRIYEYGPTMIHAKTLAVDGRWSCVGTVNFDNRSMKLNEEVAVVIDDPTLGQQLERLFLDDLTRSREVRVDDLVHRSAVARLREHAARLVAPLL